MRILALIAARGGSKRLPGKNTRLLGNKPMIVWSIEVAKNIPEICDILVSTDDPAIAEVSAAAHALVPWLRPSYLATDTATSVDVALHALDWYESKSGEVDGLLLLQPTSPFRSQKTVCRGIELFTRGGQQPVVGVSPAVAHPMWTLKMAGEYVAPFMQDHGFDKRFQDLPSAYAINGSFYLISPTDLREKRSFIDLTARPLVVESPEESLDIDTMWDFRIAELVAKSHHDR
jgi:CMP-N,N'-diacetyllegionaminic acid synthase